MQQIMGYYCWVKQVRVVETKTEMFATILSTGTPPTKRAGALAFSGNQDIDEDETGSSNPPKKVEGTPSLGLAWMPDIGFAGDPKQGAFQFRPIAAGREDAIKWIQCEQGIKWLADAVNYFLIGFGVRGAQFINPVDMNDYRIEPIQSSFGSFDETLWDGEFKKEAYRHRGNFLKRKDWTNINLDACIKGVDPKLARHEVEKAVKDDWEKVAVQATREHLSAWHAIQPVLAKGQIPDPWANGLTDTIELVGRLIEDTLPPLAYFKRQFNVARPLAEGEAKLTIPGHPAFPSGHATQAMLVALVFGDIVNDAAATEAMVGEAKVVAKHRMQAGLHYDMDMKAGIFLAQELRAAMNTRANAAFKELAARVAQELKTVKHTPQACPSVGGCVSMG